MLLAGFANPKGCTARAKPGKRDLRAPAAGTIDS
jgi:hypothetical protein